MNEFDDKAAGWDMNPMHWDRSRAVVNEIIKRISLEKDMVVLEYGAGTGISGFLLRDSVKEVTMMDSSAEMVRLMNEKIVATNAINLKAVQFDLEHEEYSDGQFDFIYTQMVLHHVSDIDSIMKRFSLLLRTGGYLAIADLYEEDGSFHGNGFQGHRGFNPDHLTVMLEDNRFEDISHAPCFTIEKRMSETESKQYEVFLLVARKL